VRVELNKICKGTASNGTWQDHQEEWEATKTWENKISIVIACGHTLHKYKMEGAQKITQSIC